MRSKTMTIMAAAVLFLPTIAHAQPSDLKIARDEAHNGVTGWTFAVLTMRKYRTELTVKREPYGVFTSRDDCDIARAKKIVELDRGNYRQPHLLPDAQLITTTITVGANTVGAKSITTQEPGGPTETMNVTDCEAQKFSADSQMAQKN
jgi:hypothetical protein